MPSHWEKGHHCGRRQPSREIPDTELSAKARKLLAETAADGETVITSFDASFASCDCVTHLHSTVECIIVGQGPRIKRERRPNGSYTNERTYRCLLCGATWVAWYRRKTDDED